jgi:hypothetical protein
MTGYGAPYRVAPLGKLVGYRVLGTDGEVGTVNEAAIEDGRSYLVIGGAGWPAGHPGLIPANAVREIDHDRQTVHVGITREQIRQRSG